MKDITIFEKYPLEERLSCCPKKSFDDLENLLRNGGFSTQIWVVDCVAGTQK